MVHFQWKQGEGGSPLVAPAHMPDAAGTVLLCSHRAALSSQIKINFIPSKSVYALNMDGQACAHGFAKKSLSA